MTAYPSVDDSLAGEVLEAIGIRVPHGVEQVVDAFRRWLPAGSTAKWEAVDADRRPPGTDPSVALEARLGGSLDSWSCWPYCTGLGGVLRALGHDVRLAVEQLRTGRNVPPVDFHSVLVVDGSMVDVYLGPSAPVAPGEDVVRSDAWAAWVPGVRPDHLGARGGSTPFRYRQLADHLDGRDVDAFCDISVTHTGVGRRRTAHWLRSGALWFVRESDGGGAELRVTEGDSPFASRRRLVDTGDFDQLMGWLDSDRDLPAPKGTPAGVEPPPPRPPGGRP